MRVVGRSGLLWIHFVGNRRLVPAPDLRAVVYHDPAAYPVLVRIGALDLGHGPATIGRDQAGVDFIAWELAPGAGLGGAT